METKALDKQQSGFLSSFYYLAFLYVAVTSLAMGFLYGMFPGFPVEWASIICVMVFIVAFIVLGCKKLEISSKELIFKERRKDVAVSDALLLLCLFFSIICLLHYLHLYFIRIVLKVPNRAIPASTTALPVMLSYMLSPMVRETMFRVVGLQLFEKVGGKTYAVIYTSIAYAIIHLNRFFLVNILFGLCAALLVYLTGTVWYSLLMSFLMGFNRSFVGLLFPNLSYGQMLFASALVMIFLMIASLILLRKRPVFQELLQWCDTKKIRSDLNSNRENYKDAAGSSVFLIYLFLGIAIFMGVMVIVSNLG